MARIVCMQEWLIKCACSHLQSACMQCGSCVHIIYLYAGVAQLLCMHAEVAHNLSCSSSSLSMYIIIHVGVAILLFGMH